MEVTIKLPSLMDFEKDIVTVVIDQDSAKVFDLVEAIAHTEWGREIIENGRIKAPFGLVIDGELIMLNDNPDITIQEGSEIRIIPVLSGG